MKVGEVMGRAQAVCVWDVGQCAQCSTQRFLQCADRMCAERQDDTVFLIESL